MSAVGFTMNGCPGFTDETSLKTKVLPLTPLKV